MIELTERHLWALLTEAYNRGFRNACSLRNDGSKISMEADRKSSILGITEYWQKYDEYGNQ